MSSSHILHFFCSNLLRFPHCSAMIHELSPAPFSSFFMAAAMFHEFQAAQFYSLLLKFCNVFFNSACSICLPASQMLKCFTSSRHILHFFQFQPAPFSSLLLRCCNVSWVPAIFFISFVPTFYVFLIVRQWFMSSRLLRFPPFSWLLKCFMSFRLHNFTLCLTNFAMFF